MRGERKSPNHGLLGVAKASYHKRLDDGRVGCIHFPEIQDELACGWQLAPAQVFLDAENERYLRL